MYICVMASVRSIGFILFLVLSLFAAGCGDRKNEGGNEALLRELDRAVAGRHLLEEPKLRRIDSLKRELRTSAPQRRMDICFRLCDEYRYYNIDSAVLYVRRMKQLAASSREPRMMAQARLMMSMVYPIAGRESDALREHALVDTSYLTPTEMIDYLNTGRTLAATMRQRSDNDSLRRRYSELIDSYGRRRLEITAPDSPEHGWFTGVELFGRGEYDGAFDSFAGAFDTATDPHLRARIAYEWALCCSAMGDLENYERLLAVSSLNDLHAAVKEYISLPRLAILLFERGDVERANRYMRCTMEDLLFCNHNSRVLQFSASNEAISAAFADVMASRRHIAIAMVIAVSLFAAAVVLALRWALQQKRRVQAVNADLSVANEMLVSRNAELSDLNIRLRDINERLTDANRIKEQYVGHYMDLCSSYIGKIDEYRHRLNKTVNAGGVEAVKRELMSPDFADRERREFYRMFDSTFLDIFPDFVDRVNALLVEGERFKPKSGRTLNTELRILAVIRLGITDSVKIAYFLNCSLSTIYNYRTKMRNAAIGDRDGFEAAVQRIMSEQLHNRH